MWIWRHDFHLCYKSLKLIPLLPQLLPPLPTRGSAWQCVAVRGSACPSHRGSIWGSSRACRSQARRRPGPRGTARHRRARGSETHCCTTRCRRPSWSTRSTRRPLQAAHRGVRGTGWWGDRGEGEDMDLEVTGQGRGGDNTGDGTEVTMTYSQSIVWFDCGCMNRLGIAM